MVVTLLAGRIDARGGQATDRATLADFGAFYEQTYATAYRTAFAIVGESALAADAVQDAYLSAFRERGRFRGESSAETWLIRIVVNTAVSTSRRQRVRWVDSLGPELANHRDEAHRSVERLSIVSALQGLPPKERAAVVLRFYLDYDYATIARCLNTSTGTVGSWLSRAIDRLRLALEPDRPAPGSTQAGHRRG